MNIHAAMAFIAFIQKSGTHKNALSIALHIDHLDVAAVYDKTVKPAVCVNKKNLV